MTNLQKNHSSSIKAAGEVFDKVMQHLEDPTIKTAVVCVAAGLLAGAAIALIGVQVGATATATVAASAIAAAARAA